MIILCIFSFSLFYHLISHILVSTEKFIQFHSQIFFYIWYLLNEQNDRFAVYIYIMANLIYRINSGDTSVKVGVVDSLLQTAQFIYII